MPAESETSRKSTRRTTASAQAAEKAAERAAEKAAEKAEREAARLEQQVKSSGGYRGSTQTNFLRLNQLDNASAQAGILGNPVKDELDKGGDRASSPKKLVQGTRQRTKVDYSASTGDSKGQSLIGTPKQAASAQATGAQTTARSWASVARGVRSEEQDPNGQPSAPPRHLPDPPTSRSNTLPTDGIKLLEQDLCDADHVEYSDNESDNDDEDYESARELAERAALAGFEEALTQEELETLYHQEFQAQQREAHRQMYLQQQQLIEEAHATAPKSHSGRSTTTMLGIGGGGSSDKPTSKEKALRRKLAEVEYELQQSNSSAMNLDHHYRKLWTRANAQSEELQRAQHQVQRLLDDNRSLTHELEAVKLQLPSAKALLAKRDKELKAAQVFLTKADTLSTTDVVQKVNALNEEIFQASALLGEMIQTAEHTDRTQDQATDAFEKARWMLGEGMASILATESTNIRTDLNPLLVQIVLQIAITTWCKFVASSWKPGDHPVADFLSAIYSEIRKIEDQAVSGHWRSITRAQLRSSSDDWTENLMSGLLSVLIIAGWSTREPDQQRQFEKRLPPIFKAVQDLRKALGEDVTSMDMEVVIIEAGEAFNSTYMEDGYRDARASSGSGKKGAPEKVSGTTGLGLHKITMERTEKGVIPKVEMVLFPKVALDGTLKEAMDPAPPPTSRLRKKAKRDGDRSPGFGNTDGRD